MDEISRELPPDTTTPNRAEPASASREIGTGSKGPEELLRFERAQITEHLVVRARFGLEAAMSELPPAGEERPAEEPAAQPEATQPEATSPEATQQAEVSPADAEPVVADGEPVGLADGIDHDAALRAVAAEADVAELEEDLEAAEEDGLPAVPELTDPAAVARVAFVLMLSSRESLSVLRLAQTCNTTQKVVEQALVLLQDQLRGLGLGLELTRTGDSCKWMSTADNFIYLQRLRGVKKMEKLSPAALETLAVIAYRQPVMRSDIEAIRGVKAGPMLRTLLQHKLIKVAGRADVPGRPLQYGTTQQFLERFGIASLQELPSIKEWKNLG
ncbi:MAG: SMC-Scp complex subunit ScpB [Planctomycetes bacterium]|nr:SMC-Scp complex subunit ScpB [Planctomycetota bacterium]MCC7396226.1 SMC-Scp complex subunit ScpB [Planctomycetota bacterium]